MWERKVLILSEAGAAGMGALEEDVNESTAKRHWARGRGLRRGEFRGQ